MRRFENANWIRNRPKKTYAIERIKQTTEYKKKSWTVAEVINFTAGVKGCKYATIRIGNGKFSIGKTIPDPIHTPVKIRLSNDEAFFVKTYKEDKTKDEEAHAIVEKNSANISFIERIIGTSKNKLRRIEHGTPRTKPNVVAEKIIG